MISEALKSLMLLKSVKHKRRNVEEITRRLLYIIKMNGDPGCRAPL